MEALTGINTVDPLLKVRNLKKYFPVQSGPFRRETGWVRAVDDVSFEIGRGETLGLVGETGCGKTTLGRCVVRLYRPLAGQILYRGQGTEIDLATLTSREFRPHRRDIQMIFQDPYSSLDPRRTVFATISEPLRANQLASGRELEERVIHLMEVVGLETRYLRRYPHAFSGGQRQRIGIARALATNPRLIVADEPVSALDVSIQAQILNLLGDLQDQFGLSYLFIAHDLSVVKYVSDRPCSRRSPYPTLTWRGIGSSSRERSRTPPTRPRAATFTRAARMREHCASRSLPPGIKWQRDISPPATLPGSSTCAA
jgi:peptide/nickel transport system ATP-binding protein